MFPRLRASATVVADTNFRSGTQKMFLILFRNILCPQQMFSSLRSPRNIMGNNVSSSARAFRAILQWLYVYLNTQQFLSELNFTSRMLSKVARAETEYNPPKKTPNRFALQLIRNYGKFLSVFDFGPIPSECCFCRTDAVAKLRCSNLVSYTGCSSERGK